MSHKLENQFKEALQNMEAPYNPKAWESLQARLDVAMPVASPKNPFSFWKVSAVVIGTVGVAAALYFLNSNTHVAEDNSIANVEIKEKGINEETPISDKNVNQIGEVKTTEPKENLGNKGAVKSVENGKVGVEKKIINTSTSKFEMDKSVQSSAPIQNLNTHSIPNVVDNSFKSNSNSNSAPFHLPIVGKQCVNDELKIQNDNTSNLVIVYPSGKKVIIGSKKQSVLKISESGTYTLTDGYFATNSFVAQASQEPEFEIDIDNIYKNGVPSTLVKATSNAANYSWNVNSQNKAGRESEFHFFKKGEYAIHLQTTDQNGCKNSTSKNVIIQKDYNLMAVDAFNPEHNDIRKNTFMPFALKERNVGFTLTIIDPKDASIIYQTSDADAGWDGIDSRTGKMAENGSNYIWKVNLSSPMPGENESYRGVVFVAR